MALSLSAEQKSIEDIFFINDQYIIPNYQRSYSWRFEQCNQMYLDFLSAYTNKIDYFMGNIIIARGQDERKKPQVVDGQQRLITLWILLKTLSVLCPNLSIKEQYLTIPSKRKDGESILKIKSEVFETKDDEQIKEIFGYTIADFRERLKNVSDKKNEIREDACNSRFEYTALLFYQYLSSTEGYQLIEFTDYILEHIFLLPIELNGSDMAEANDKALTIFETINNRGMSLENADIFKAKLYNKALLTHTEDLFKAQWADFRISVEELGLSVDDIFRYYSHIIRGRENVIASEKNLRDFFLLDSASPIFKNEYEETMRDLLRIVEILQDMERMKTENEIFGPWLQIVDAYSNVYPKYVIITYLFNNTEYVEDDFLEFLKSLVRYIYSFGASTTVKFEVYKMITKVSMKLSIDSYYATEKDLDYDRFRALRKGYSLLYHYLNNGEFLKKYWFDKLLYTKDIEELKKMQWEEDTINTAIKSIANTIVINTPIKRRKMMDRHNSYKHSTMLNNSSSIFCSGNYTASDFQKYSKSYKTKMDSFFLQP